MGHVEVVSGDYKGVQRWHQEEVGHMGGSGGGGAYGGSGGGGAYGGSGGGGAYGGQEEVGHMGVSFVLLLHIYRL